MKFKPFGESRLDIADITPAQTHVACMALEKIAERLLQQKQTGAAELMTRLCRAVLEQNQARMEDALRPGKAEEPCSPAN